MKISFDKKVYRLPPLNLIDAVRRLNPSHRSWESANRFFEAGLECLNEYNLYMPFIHYSAKLTYSNSNDSPRAFILYQRFANFGDEIDRMEVNVFTGEVNVAVEVSRGFSSKTGLRKTATGITSRILGPDGLPVNGESKPGAWI